ncbi:MAG TPA: helix-turn-helix transcriptional regulator [Streptosporangiaceae bacterium]|nr:helix-turn-helix transcriptional regulator [Streptosporangiaceae bacterium]
MTLEDAAAYACRGRGRRRRAPRGWAGLTPTELTVARAVSEGLSNPQIAKRMFISRRTVATHLTSIFRKPGVSSRAELAAAAARQAPVAGTASRSPARAAGPGQARWRR